MASSWKFVGLAASTASLLCMQLFVFPNPGLTHGFEHSSELGVLPSAWKKDLLVSQATNSGMSFIPPATRATRRSQGSGSRGCDNESLASNLVTLLIPAKDYAGQTLSGRPTFFWHLSKAVSVPMQFTLVEGNVAGKTVLEKQIDAPKPGIIQVELPKDQPELVPGRIYRWTVSLVCNSNRRSEDLFFQSWIQRVPTAPELERKLTNESSQTPRSRATIYAQEGLWYDALTTLSTALNANPQDSAVQADFLSLLNQVGLSEVVQQEHQRLAQR
jgi:hypothetical protein